jgi:hypothetical protein
MQHILSVIAAASALAVPQTGVATSAPVAVSTCAITDLVSPALMAEFGPPVSSRALQLSFRNGADVTATQVTFDVAHDGTHTTVIDRGRFSTGSRIDHVFDDVAGAYGGSDAVCTVTAVTFADGARWTVSGGAISRAEGAAQPHRRRDRTFRPDYSRALSAEQMSRAWRDEENRIDPPIVTGGG